MSIIFAGGLLHEVVLGQKETNNATFDPTYAPYSLRPYAYDSGYIAMTVSPVLPDVITFDNWVQFKMYRSGPLGGPGSSSFNAFTIYDQENTRLVRINVAANGSYLYLQIGDEIIPNQIDITGFLGAGVLQTVSIQITQDGTDHTVNLYIDGILQATITEPNTVQKALGVLKVQNTSYSNPHAWHLSEILMTDGESPLGARVLTTLPTGVATVNDWVGDWSSLADDDTASGISTDQSAQRIAGGFTAYSGPQSPIGIRAVVQSIRYVDNNSGLNVKGFLRSGSTNIDTFSYSHSDESRVFTVWDDNPFTSTDWEVADIDQVEGGVRSDS